MQIAYNFAIKTTDNNKRQIEIIRESLKILSNISSKSFTAGLSIKIIKRIEELTGVIDPYKEEKQKSNEIMLDLEKSMNELINSYKNDFERFYKIILLTIFGNIIDFATGGHHFELSRESMNQQMIDVLELKPKINSSKKFYNLIKTGNKNIMYLVDNAGEIVCDKFLIKNLVNYGNKVIIVVKNKPLANDVTTEDIKYMDLSQINGVRIIEGERFCLGFLFNNVPSIFKHELQTTDILISKGQNHFETIMKYQNEFLDKDIIFILRVKCDPLAKFLGVKKGDNIIKYIKFN